MKETIKLYDGKEYDIHEHEVGQYYCTEFMRTAYGEDAGPITVEEGMKRLRQVHSMFLLVPGDVISPDFPHITFDEANPESIHKDMDTILLQIVDAMGLTEAKDLYLTSQLWYS